ncbi:MAG: hypothetical protein ACTSQ7_06200 [Alphaproteobacteria bacterium]
MIRLVTALFLTALLIVNVQPAGSALAQNADAIASKFKFENLSKQQKSDVELTEKLTSPKAAEAGALSSYTQGDFLRDQVATDRLITILVIGLALLSLFVVLHFLNKVGCKAGDIIIGGGLVVVSYGTIILALTVSTEQQLMAAIGVLGALAGYLFGASGQRETTPIPTLQAHPDQTAADADR